MDTHDENEVGAIPVERMCGSRVVGKTYVEVGVGPNGTPLEEFLICPPIDPNIYELTIPNRGVRMIKMRGVWHIFDRVGMEYPNRIG